MDVELRTVLWRQLGAAIDMLENAIVACPEELWSDRSRQPEVWYMVYHTLFFLDLYRCGAVEGFAPPAPFNLDELDPAGLLPERVYAKDELLSYLRHGREGSRSALAGLTAEEAGRRCRFPWGELSYLELVIYSLRHVQHHAAQLNLLLRQETGAAPRWVARALEPLGGPR